MTPAEKIIYVKRYFELMSASDIAGIVDLFDVDATVLSPFLGEMRARDFFTKLGNASESSKLTVFDVLLGENGNSAAAHFTYDWTLKSGEKIVFQGVDYFKFNESGRFSSMSIFYDTYPLRAQVGDKYVTA